MKDALAGRQPAPFHCTCDGNMRALQGNLAAMLKAAQTQNSDAGIRADLPHWAVDGAVHASLECSR